MENRACERIPVNKEVSFFCDDSLYGGIVTNLSEKGMCIDMKIRLDIKVSTELLVTFKEEGLDVPAKVKRIETADSLSDTMGVEVLNLSRKYLEFVDSLRVAYKFFKTSPF
jgi:hypothetical protein